MKIFSRFADQIKTVFFFFRVLVDTVAHFPPSLEEVTVTVSDERMWVRNYVEDETGNAIAVLRRKRQMVA